MYVFNYKNSSQLPQFLSHTIMIAGELLYSVRISKPRIIFCSERVLERMDQVAREAGFVQEIVTFGLPFSHKQTPFVSFLRHKSSSFQPLDVNDKDHTAAILSSSGTTGLPKGVVLTQGNFLSTFRNSK
jgi:long-subunit acyl-CoA synthetase (AMP-forming)